MKVIRADFIKSAVKPGQYPSLTLPEVAFAGRSNVGKSSLINSLTGRKGLVKVSKTPGKTQLLNFFKINDALTLVDMPGYGFANVPEKTKESWGEMVETYLKNRDQLKCVVSLLDCRRVPNEDDIQLLTWLRHYEVPTVIVFTKIDKIPKTHRIRFVREAMAPLTEVTGGAAKPVMYSSLSGEGKRELWIAIETLSRLRKHPG
ncbi:MAG: YihA family ribosome biogenesis GTP-binding protein [Nitrospinae bacterium]|nr:YihA family ribosome biogenesis GTP-binding protein [Nitrospinota bacterium]